VTSNPKSGTDPISFPIFETARGNLCAYGEFFEQALWQLFFHLGLTPTALRGEIRMAGVQQNISYRKERKLRMEHELLNVESNEVCATCELTAVCIDASTRTPRTFPPEVKTRATRLLHGETS
jgi:acyl-CoA thioester hydrolase